MIYHEHCFTFKLLCLTTVALFGLVASQNSAEYSFPGQLDLVTSLPNYAGDYSKIGHYSGYLEGGNDSFLYYWFFQSKSGNNWHNDPVVVWFAGGPGESSVASALSWFGPMTLLKNDSLDFDHSHSKHTWTHKANMLFIETPVGVGFSYQNIPKDKNTTTTTDRPEDGITATHNNNAIKHFFVKFPQLKNNDFYMASYSYGSVYTSLLGVRLVKDKFPPNFKGIFIESGVFDHSHVYAAFLEYGRQVGIFKQSELAPVIDACCHKTFCSFTNCSITPRCGLNDTSTCCIAFKALQSHYFYSLNVYKFDDDKLIDPKGANPQRDEWFRSAAVRKALRISENSNVHWTDFHARLHQNYTRDVVVLKSVRQLLENGIRIFSYYGDSDLIVNYLNGLWLLDKLKDKLQNVQPIAPWYFNNDQMAGYQGRYVYNNKTNFTFMVIRGAGHAVSYYQSEVVYKLLSDFIDGFV